MCRFISYRKSGGFGGQVLRVWPDGRLEEREGLPEKEVGPHPTFCFTSSEFIVIQIYSDMLYTCL